MVGFKVKIILGLMREMKFNDCREIERQTDRQADRQIERGGSKKSEIERERHEVKDREERETGRYLEKGKEGRERGR